MWSPVALVPWAVDSTEFVGPFELARLRDKLRNLLALGRGGRFTTAGTGFDGEGKCRLEDLAGGWARLLGFLPKLSFVCAPSP